MVRNKGNRKAMLNQLQKLEALYMNKTSVDAVTMSINEDGTISIDPAKTLVFDTLEDVITKGFKKNYTVTEKTTVFIDDFYTVPDGIYLPADVLWTIEAEKRRNFIELAKSDPVKWLQAYIDLLKDRFEINEIDYNPKIYPHSICYMGRWLTDDELRENDIEMQIRHRQTSIEITKDIMWRYPAIVDLLEQFDKMTVPDLLERYKDQKWFNKSENTVPDILGTKQNKV